MFTFVLLMISFVALVLATLNVVLSPRINLLALGLAAFVLAALVPAFVSLTR